jgi:hypothetical protein
MLSREDIEHFRRMANRPSLKDGLAVRAKLSYPYPPNPFCSSDISVDIVREALKEAGYENFRLHVAPEGIYIEPSS